MDDLELNQIVIIQKGSLKGCIGIIDDFCGRKAIVQIGGRYRKYYAFPAGSLSPATKPDIEARYREIGELLENEEEIPAALALEFTYLERLYREEI